VITHSKVSAVSDGGDAGKVRPSDWNAEHILADGYFLPQIATVPLNNDAIKALPSTPVEIIPAPGAGKIILPFTGLLSLNMVGVYTNVGYNGAGGISNLYLAFDFSTILGMPDTSEFGGSLSSSTGLILWSMMGGKVYKPDDDDVTWGVAIPYASKSQLLPGENKPFVLHFDNYTANYDTNLGNLIGGDPANTLKVTVIYHIIDL
jgi:hypothetical protein